MSTPQISPRPLQEQLPLQLNNLAPLDMQPNALALQEARNLALLGQALEIINEKDKVLEQEHAKTHQQDQETILNLQKAQQALILRNAQLEQESIVLKSQIDQMNTAHQADLRAALEHNSTLEEALRNTRLENNDLKKDVTHLKKTVEIHEESSTAIKNATTYARAQANAYPGSKHAQCAMADGCVYTESKIAEMDKKLLEQKKKEEEEDRGYCIQ